MSKDHGSRPTFEQWAGLTHHIVQERFEWAWTPDPEKRNVKHVIEYDDLIQHANYALVDAINLWDSTRGVKFQTYAYRSIYNRVKRHINSELASLNWRAVKFSEIEFRLAARKSREAIQILDPTQDAELYNVLHVDWVAHCVGQLREGLGEGDLQMLVDHAAGRSFTEIAAEKGICKSAVRRQYNKLLKAAYYILKDQEDLLE